MATISVKVDEELKENFSKVCNDLGISMSEMIREFAKTTVSGKKFSINDLGYDENGFVTDEELKRRYEDAKAGRNLEKHNLEEM